MQGYFLKVNGTAQQPYPGHSRSGRGYPDLALAGSMFVFVVGGEFLGGGGTSVSTPIMAGMISLINAARFRAGGKPVGWINSILYDYSSIFMNDVTVGDNRCTALSNCCKQGFYAAPGWDPASGLGSINFKRFKTFMMAISNLPPKLEFTPTILTRAPTRGPTTMPATAPTWTPTFRPTSTPTSSPSPSPSTTPSVAPSPNPSPSPSTAPSVAPTSSPSPSPSTAPSVAPTSSPSPSPSTAPSVAPTPSPSPSPSTVQPTDDLVEVVSDDNPNTVYYDTFEEPEPTARPTRKPSRLRMRKPTRRPTRVKRPTRAPQTDDIV